MRRSAAPSQLLKRSQFRPPFVGGVAKRPCLEVKTPSGQSPGLCKPTQVRSPKDILSLIQTPGSAPLGNCEHPHTSDSTNTALTDDDTLEKNIVPDDSPSQSTISDQTVSPSDKLYLQSSYSVSNSNNLVPGRDFVRPGHTQSHASARRPLGQTVQPGAVWSRQVRPGVTPPTGEENQEPPQTKYYSVVWCKRSNKKHKKWEGDAVLIVKTRSVVLKDTEGREIGRGMGYKLADLASLQDGSTLPVGSKEVEIQSSISAESFASGSCFIGEMEPSPATQPLVRPRPKPKPFRLPTLSRPSHTTENNRSNPTPLFDPARPDALVMPRPPSQHQWQNSNSVVVDVVVDPHVSGHLRPHQQEGVVFLYECVMGYRTHDTNGAILADEMGLGKTLQCVALVWTLLKQDPYHQRPVVRRVLVVTPSSLTVNWGKEFTKWLGRSRLQVYIVDQNNKAENFGKQTISPVMVISYEMFIRCAQAIKELKFDLMICDEGHRLKNANIKTASLLGSIGCKRRVLLTGTPLQNDIQELYALVEFVNPGVLGSSASFRHVYEDPIVASQQPQSTEEERQLGTSRAAQLNRITSMFILRRTQEVINRYLPAKSEYVVFCQPTETQLEVYHRVLGCRGLNSCLAAPNGTDTLSALMTLRKVCNHPALLARGADEETVKSELIKEVAAFLPSHLEVGKYEETDSGKLAVLSCMLWALHESETREKIVVVSNYTSTLDVVAALCKQYSYTHLRLDGSTPTHRRQQLVDRFNCATSNDFVFLLSARAGGVGLNLVGASRILLYDLDWNPATDLQAMARVWRDGQRKKVHIYRLLLTGTVDEKMYQRQIKKQGLSGTVVDARESQRVHFSVQELKDLFTLHSDTACLTHDLLQCECDQQGGQAPAASYTQQDDTTHRACQLGSTSTTKSTSSTTTMDQLYSWHHLAPPFSSAVVKDWCLEAASDFITFIFSNEARTEVAPISSPSL
ncbi:hypothetical protein Pcinc_023686 [Petrolisthes cinctipes]|uniref:DNA repair and recombination protein RAD54-like n=1 Tax=Petrolisthes cinctipes TaxID=88211 RepID=A0AAE1FD28_PETCI|nr:hypothetical protein Pcinc_023686 [Petrolisthes cinctipes]